MQPFVAAILDAKSRFEAGALPPDQFKAAVMDALSANINASLMLDEIKAVIGTLKFMVDKGVLEKQVYEEVGKFLLDKHDERKAAGITPPPPPAGGLGGYAGAGGQGGYGHGPVIQTAPSGNFTIGEAIKYGWAVFKQNPLAWAVVTIVPFLAQMIIGGVLGYMAGDSGAMALIAQIGSTVVSWVVAMGFIRVSLRAVDEPGHRPNLGEFVIFNESAVHCCPAKLPSLTD